VPLEYLTGCQYKVTVSLQFMLELGRIGTLVVILELGGRIPEVPTPILGRSFSNIRKFREELKHDCYAHGLVCISFLYVNFHCRGCDSRETYQAGPFKFRNAPTEI
jgi:hypothetical protein